MPVNKPVLLVVLDGWGIAQAEERNGVHRANTPNFDRLASTYPYTTLKASGEAVGLPDGQMGNSEVGHMTIGAGMVQYQDLVRVSKAVESGEIAQNPALNQAFKHAKDHQSQLHVIGLLSPGGVHAHEDHFIEIVRLAHAAGVTKIICHPILDGRDHSPVAGVASLKKLEDVCLANDAKIASTAGRYWPMDRDKNWDRTDKGFDAIWHGKAEHMITNQSPSEWVDEQYRAGHRDELMEPAVFYTDGEKPFTAQPNDSVIYTNYRTDRTRQLSQKITERVDEMNLCFVTMTDYGQEIKSIVAFAPQDIEHTIASAVSAAGLKQSHLAETDKYAHATYFLNGGKQDPHQGEEHILVPSRKDVKTHDQAPEMMAKELCDKTIERLLVDDFIFLNWANPDMVGHTAVPEAIITAVETVDRELGRLSEAVLKTGGTMLVIADHGNAEQMVDDDGNPHTSHTTNPVPCIVIGKEYSGLRSKNRLRSGELKDVAPTVLGLLGVDVPSSMTGKSLLI